MIKQKITRGITLVTLFLMNQSTFYSRKYNESLLRKALIKSCELFEPC